MDELFGYPMVTCEECGARWLMKNSAMAQSFMQKDGEGKKRFVCEHCHVRSHRQVCKVVLPEPEPCLQDEDLNPVL